MPPDESYNDGTDDDRTWSSSVMSEKVRDFDTVSSNSADTTKAT